jgi:methylmalonyl-CoA mutase N-terminal domain/subunit
MEERDKKKFVTSWGMEVKPHYTEEDLRAFEFDPNRDLGVPGQYPYTRGIDSEMYRKDLWVMGHMQNLALQRKPTNSTNFY